MKIQILGAHNTESKDTKLLSILIDDCLLLDAGGVTSSLSLEEQLGIKSVLLTHQHYDHIRDIPALSMNFYLGGKTLDIYSTKEVYQDLMSSLLDGTLYPDFTRRPAENPALKFHQVEPGDAIEIEEYSVLPGTVNHAIPTIGYQIDDSNEKTLFFTGDTGPELEKCWEQVSPQLLIIEVTEPNDMEEHCLETGHLTPGLLKQELESFQEINSYLPRVITVHMNPRREVEITSEINELNRFLNIIISVGYEGMQIVI